MLNFTLHKSPLVSLRPVVFTVLVAALLVACSDGSDSRPGDGGQEPVTGYSAQIERTQYGTAHITADSYGSLGFGQGYAFAQDRFCVLADQIVKVRSQRARYFGAGEQEEHIETDIAYLALGVMEKAAGMIDEMSEDGREMLHGYVAGYNQYLAETGVANLPEDCADQEWVQPIDAESLIAYYLDLAMLNGSRGWLSEIAAAHPPVAQGVAGSPAGSELSPSGAGSNVVALGADVTASGRGMLLSNTHLPWEGELKYHEVHLTIPGVIDVAGVSISGLFGVVNGFNRTLAWSHTFSTSNQFIVYSLDLVPNQPTRYRFGEEERDMEARTHTISVRQPDGSLQQQSHTLYHSQYGPMLGPAFGLLWTDEKAYTFFDMNADNGTLVDTWLAMAKADSVLALQEIIGTVGSVTFNILATDRSGQTFYADASLVPKLNETAEVAFHSIVENEAPSITKILFRLPYGFGFVLLDGSDPIFTVEHDPGATLPGMTPFSEAPQLLRRDFVANSNDSYWISNPAQPLSGYSIRYGNIENPRKLRTRMGLTQILETSKWT